MESRDSVSNEELNETLLKLSRKIDRLSSQLEVLSDKLDKIQPEDNLELKSKNEVEIEEQNALDEDYLMPADIVFENEALQKTGTTLIKLRIATASEIAQITGKDRAVESFYLNDLWSRNKVRKIRIGRKVYFYAGRASEIEPFKNSEVKTEWRELLVSIIQNVDTFEVNKKIQLNKLAKNDSEINELKEKLEVIASQTEFLKLQNFDSSKPVIEFIATEWLKLA